VNYLVIHYQKKPKNAPNKKKKKNKKTKKKNKRTKRKVVARAK